MESPNIYIKYQRESKKKRKTPVQDKKETERANEREKEEKNQLVSEKKQEDELGR